MGGEEEEPPITPRRNESMKEEHLMISPPLTRGDWVAVLFLPPPLPSSPHPGGWVPLEGDKDDSLFFQQSVPLAIFLKCSPSAKKDVCHQERMAIKCGMAHASSYFSFV